MKLDSVGPRVKGDVDLPSAKRIVSVGRGIKEEKDLEMVRELCSLIDAELGCSRSIYEAESWLPKEALGWNLGQHGGARSLPYPRHFWTSAAHGRLRRRHYDHVCEYRSLRAHFRAFGLWQQGRSLHGRSAA